MSAGVEAQSLSGINHLAANPPKFPRNPTQQRHEPLTLYIARVPGTSDVILSPLKPQLKNVTAEDVTTALYYLHLDSEEEVAAFAQDRARKSSTLSAVSNIARKPVGSRSSGLTQVEKPCKVKENIEFMMQRGVKSISRKPVPESSRSSSELAIRPIEPVETLEQLPTSSMRESSPEGSASLSKKNAVGGHGQDHSNVAIFKKPQGPRPLEPGLAAGTPAPEGQGFQDIGSATHVKDFALPPQFEAAQSSISPPTSTSTLEKVDSPPSKTFSVTVIRRDPLSGAQWNVSKITGRSSSTERLNRPVGPLARKPFYHISVHVMNPSYDYFRSFPTATPPPGTRGQITQAVPLDTDPKAPADPQNSTPSGFSTDVHMEGVDIWSSALKQRARALSDLSNTLASARERRPVEGMSTPQTNSDVHDAAEAARGRGRGYTFGSIWGGTCKFSTGPSGRNLKCSHTLPGPVFQDSSSASVMVSDLRFNLPLGVDLSKKALAARSKHLQRIPNQIRDKLSSYGTAAPPLPPRPPHVMSTSTSDDDEAPAIRPRPSPRDVADVSSDENLPRTAAVVLLNEHAQHALPSDEHARLDLSLGQEMAGGGNRGKRAKLGKLIIYDEGLKMLDLVIAANMGVWWSIWDSDH